MRRASSCAAGWKCWGRSPRASWPHSLGLGDTALVDGALLALEDRGTHPARTVQAARSPDPDPRLRPRGREALEWCDRRLLARIHRYTLSRLRAEIEPVTAADFMRFLLHWQHVARRRQRERRRRPRRGRSSSSTATSWRRRRGSTTCCRRACATTAPELHRHAVPVRPRGVGPPDADGRRGQGAAQELADRAHAARARRAVARRRRAGDAEALTSEARAVHEALRARGALVLPRARRGDRAAAHAGRARARRAGRRRARDRRQLQRAARAAHAAGEAQEPLGRAPSARRSAYGVDTAGTLGAAGRLRPTPTADAARPAEDEQRRSDRARAAQALRRRVPLAARARIAAADVARAGDGLSPARGARRDPRRALRLRLRRRAVRAARCGGPAARGAQAGEERRARSRSPAPIRSTSSASSRPTRAFPRSRRTACCSATGSRSPRWKAAKCAGSRHSDLDDETLRGLLVRRASAQAARSHLRSADAAQRRTATQKKRVYAASVR